MPLIKFMFFYFPWFYFDKKTYHTEIQVVKHKYLTFFNKCIGFLKYFYINLLTSEHGHTYPNPILMVKTKSHDTYTHNRTDLCR